MERDISEATVMSVTGSAKWASYSTGKGVSCRLRLVILPKALSLRNDLSLLSFSSSTVLWAATRSKSISDKPPAAYTGY